MKSSRRILIGLVVAVLAIGGITFYNRTRSTGGELVKAVKHERSPVRGEELRPRDVTERIVHTGALAAERDVTLTAEVVGKVIRRHKELGQRCRRGEALVQLDPASYRIALLQAEAALRQAQAQLAQARRDHARTGRLAARSAVAAQTVEQAQTSVQMLQAQVKQAEAAVSLARRNLRETSIRCPFDGTVAEVRAELGQVISQQTPVARLVGTDRLKLEVRVSAAELNRLKVGQAVALVDPAQPATHYTGAVARLGVAADPVTHAFPVEVEVPVGSDGQPRPGQVVRATIVVAEHRGALTVPESALSREGERVEVFLARQGKAARVAITTGARVGQRVIVTGGLRAGDRVILVGQQGLQPGDPVELVDAPATTAAPSPAGPGAARAADAAGAK